MAVARRLGIADFGQHRMRPPRRARQRTPPLEADQPQRQHFLAQLMQGAGSPQQQRVLFLRQLGVIADAAQPPDAAHAAVLAPHRAAVRLDAVKFQFVLEPVVPD